MLTFLFAAWLQNYCHAFCIACWELKGVIVQLKNGTTIEGYATWNDGWAELGYQWSGLSDKESIDRALEENEFPKMIFDPRAQIDKIYVYTHLRSIRYPVAKGLVALRDPVRVTVKDIKALKLHPGPHDGYQGAGDVPLVTERIADLLQTKPNASCDFDVGAGDVYWVSYDASFPADELQRLCERYVVEPDLEVEKRLEGRDVFSLYYAYD
jgi:hypothetical protein